MYANWSCLRQDTAVKAPPPPPLPTDRIHPSASFAVSGLDHAGPLYCTDSGDSKKYILLFTCAVVWAVHLELVDSLNFYDTALAIRWFAAHRGIPSVFYSDDARTFRSIYNKITSLFGSPGPSGKSIAPRSPWRGGWWERLVRSVKMVLRKSLGTSVLTRVQLQTTLCEVELIVLILVHWPSWGTNWIIHMSLLLPTSWYHNLIFLALSQIQNPYRRGSWLKINWWTTFGGFGVLSTYVVCLWAQVGRGRDRPRHSRICGPSAWVGVFSRLVAFRFGWASLTK